VLDFDELTDELDELDVDELLAAVEDDDCLLDELEDEVDARLVVDELPAAVDD